MASITMSKNIFSILAEDDMPPAVAKPVKNKRKDGKISVCLWNKKTVLVEPKSRPDTTRPTRTERIKAKIAKTSHCSTNDARYLAFECLKNKEDNAKRLERTTACNNVTRRRSNGKFGVCYRQYCTFAHSEEERRPRMCSFDLACRYRVPGKSQICTFRHSDETEAQWLKRSGVILPKLPPTSKYTRKLLLTSQN